MTDTRPGLETAKSPGRDFGARIMECGGRAEGRHRSQGPSQSGVALRFPPHSKSCSFAALRYERGNPRGPSCLGSPELK